MFQPVENNVRFPDLEAEIGRFWRESAIYEKSLARRKGAEKFVFYEGPPTANGMPHPGHCLTRAIKDLYPRYQTMRGKLCERKAGWDTHGLPVEVEVCKEMGIHSKEEIEAYGIEPFIQKCQQSVWRYMKEWERLTDRLGFWLHMDEAYVTYHQSYVESVWWSLKTLFDRGLLYQGHKIVWWWAQGGTALSAGEVGQGYREVADPSVYVRFPLLDDAGKPTDTSLLVWTTTPWTLLSNQFVAVHPELEYSTVVDEDGAKLVMASALVETIAGKIKRELTVESTCQGTDLIGRRYVPPFDYYSAMTIEDPTDARAKKSWAEVKGHLVDGGTEFESWRVLAADFVTTDSGSGIVHQAPAFGEVDYDVLIAEQGRFVEGEGPTLICAVAPDGKFTEDAQQYEGRWVKEADKDITRELRDRGLLFHQEQYLHDYPFCWRADEDPLIQYPRESWFIRTTEFKDEMVANNQQINWQPEHIRDGRFGNFLDSNVDWALSRERYWGTPLPIWVCSETGKMEAIAGYDELLAKPGVDGTQAWDDAKKANPELPDDLRVHKPYIDAVTYDSPFADGARMQRVTEVIDCWYDSGAMPFAQWGYPAVEGSAERFADQFPADFISEAIDQTRGWFYSQLAISTLLFGKGASGEGAETPYPHPYRNCVVLGLMLGEDGQKMSKSKRNYREPNEIFDRYGADALRWYFFANQPPWTSIRYSERSIKESIPEFQLRLWNVYSFFVIYANLDGFDPVTDHDGDVGELASGNLSGGQGYRPVSERRELDGWILDDLYRTTQIVTERMDAYDNYGACGRITEFVDALSNWFVRRSRDRFWSDDKSDPDKWDAYWTLYECLLTVTKLIAPFVPFLAEAMWRNLAVAVFGDRVPESVHLCDYPEVETSLINDKLAAEGTIVREIASLGRAARMNAKLKVRQPLAKVEVVLAEPTHREWLVSHGELLADELNVKQIDFIEQADEYITYQVVPNFKRLGPRVGKLMPQVKKALAEADGAKLLAEMTDSGKVTLNVGDEAVELDGEDIEVRLQAKEGWAAAQGSQCVVVLATELTPALILEGVAREIVRVVQDQRKAIDCQYSDRIVIGLVTENEQTTAAIGQFAEYIQGETLAVEILSGPITDVEPVEVKVGGEEMQLYLQVANRQ
jgi:isoleucyl-tRNA synthetase